MWKQITAMTASVCLCAFLGGCLNAGPAGSNPEDGLFLMAATDLHYISPKLTDNGAAFTNMMAKSDGKMTEYATELTDAFLAEVAAAKPDALILSGDLTFNGEKQSHLDLAQKLKAVRDQGIPVAVIPGNHDIQYLFSYRYEGDEIYRAANVTSEDFEEIYQDMGYGQALSRDNASLSYVFPLSDQVRLLLLDVNAVEKPGYIPDSTLQWAETQLSEAKQAGAAVIGVTHQNVMVHNDLFIKGYRIGNYNKIVKLFEDYGVPFNLSGHIHIQNIASYTDFHEAATGSLAVWPNLYAAVEISKEGDISYRTRTVDVSGWADEHGLENPELLDFEAAARERFVSRNSGKILDELQYMDITGSQRETMEEFAVRANCLYFSGMLGAQKEQLREEEAWKLFEEKGDGMFLKEYLDSMMSGAAAPDNELFIQRETK